MIDTWREHGFQRIIIYTTLFAFCVHSLVATAPYPPVFSCFKHLLLSVRLKIATRKSLGEIGLQLLLHPIHA
jgi:hypothetical protein